MKIGLIIFSSALITGVIFYSWFNRDSDRVILTLVTAMTIGSLGFITKESISNKVEKFSTEFPVVAFFGAPNYLPLNIKLPYESELRFCLQELKSEDIPETTENVDIEFGQAIYFDALEFIIVQKIFEMFGQSWNVIAKQTNLPNGKSLRWQSLGDSGKEIRLVDFMKEFSNNYFVKHGFQNQIPEPFGGKAVFPPGTNFSVNNKDGSQGVLITIYNNYLKLNINFSKANSSVGLGEYKMLLGEANEPIKLSEPQKYGNSAYFLKIDIEQTLWLNGHPDMKKYRNWADSIVQLLDNNFNFEKIRDEHLRLFQLYGPEGIRGVL